MSATLSRSAKTQSITVPAGTFAVELMAVRLPDKQTQTFYVEQAAPRRIVKWESSTGEHAETAEVRSNEILADERGGLESALSRIGLSRRQARTP
jgi:hypothetical protein